MRTLFDIGRNVDFVDIQVFFLFLFHLKSTSCSDCLVTCWLVVDLISLLGGKGSGKVKGARKKHTLSPNE